MWQEIYINIYRLKRLQKLIRRILKRFFKKGFFFAKIAAQDLGREGRNQQIVRMEIKYLQKKNATNQVKMSKKHL